MTVNRNGIDLIRPSRSRRAANNKGEHLLFDRFKFSRARSSPLKLCGYRAIEPAAPSRPREELAGRPPAGESLLLARRGGMLV